MSKNKIKVVLCCTYPDQNNGYSKVGFELSSRLSKYENIDLHIFGFQRFTTNNESHLLERQLPENVKLYDVFANEEPKKSGFGDDLIQDYVKKVRPHIVIIYNDLIVLYRLITKLRELPEEDKTFRIVPYVDLVYQNQKNALIKFLNENTDGGIMFTDYWKDVIKSQGFNKPLHVVEHGFDPMKYYPIPKDVARRYFNINQDDFIILNLNRNQPRKRWDTCMQSFIKFLSNHREEPVKLLVGTSMQGSWDLVDVFISECRRYNLDPEKAKQHLIIMNNPQTLSDKDINVLYNCADIGLNCASGEGFGLCSYEHAAIGVPQVLPNVGGLRDAFSLENAFLVQPRWSFYADNSTDIVSGMPEVGDYNDYVEMFESAYANRERLSKFGQKARKFILDKYKWDDLTKKFYDAIIYHTKDMPLDNEPLLTNKLPMEFIIGENRTKSSSEAQNNIAIKKMEIYDPENEVPAEKDNKSLLILGDKSASIPKSIDMNILNKSSKIQTTNEVIIENKPNIDVEKELKIKVKETEEPKKDDTLKQIMLMQQQLNSLISKLT